MTGVATVHPDLDYMLSIYVMIEDCLRGQKQVKGKGDLYLPRPNRTDKSTENLARYESYVDRAVFFNVSGTTYTGLAGMIFMRPMQVELPENLAFINKDATGGGISLDQFARDVVERVLPLGRGGILTDYPIREEDTKQADIESGVVRPTLNLYHPAAIINWGVDAETNKTNLIVLLEHAQKDDADEFSHDAEVQYRVLRLTDGKYTVQIYNNPDGEFVPGPVIEVKDGNDEPFDEIPFEFVGATNNDPTVDNAPFEPLAVLNIAHFRNSADYEESSYITGQPTPIITGVTETWYKEVLKGVLAFGSRGGIPLPEKADAKLLQSEPNIMPKEAMDHKEDQMRALGAKLIETKQAEQTRKEVELNNTAETSQLAQIATNVGTALTKAIEHAEKFIKPAEDSGIEVRLNTKFDTTVMNSDERRALAEEYLNGQISFEEMRNKLIESGIASESNATAVADQLVKDAELRRKITPEPTQPKPQPTNAA